MSNTDTEVAFKKCLYKSIADRIIHVGFRSIKPYYDIQPVRLSLPQSGLFRGSVHGI